VKGSKAAKGETKKTSSAKPAGAAKSKEKTPPEAAVGKTRSTEPKKMSAIDAAAKVLGESSGAMNCQEMIKAMGEKGYWTSPGGQTPAATLYSAILRELQTKGSEARFKKAERGKFSPAGKAS
jgi:short subunit dehydrogenase-like uncharacterized protein